MAARAWHSSKRPIYHNNGNCPHGNNIESENKRDGQGVGRRICKECRRLNAKGR